MIAKVILLIETSTAYGRGLLHGIAKYSNLYGPWQCYCEPPFYIDVRGWKKKKSYLLKWGADGMIIREPQKYMEMIDVGIPTIVSPNNIPGLPFIVADNITIGKMAAEHLLERGFQNFAFCGFDEMFWSRDRAEGFAQSVEGGGFEIHLYKQPKPRSRRLWEIEQPLLVEWLKSLPKPIGLMSCNDDCGQNIIDICKIIDLHVPEEIAVIGVDNDEVICNLTSPPLSSIALNPEKDGYEAAELLDRLMNGEKMAGQTIIDHPTHIVTRQSTDILAIKDKDVIEAVRFIRQNAKEPIQVGEVAKAVTMSRRGLHRKFLKVMGRSVHKEIKRIRVEEITKMLVETNLPISQIAEDLGFPGAEHISRFFCKEKGISPLAYRKQVTVHGF